MSAPIGPGDWVERIDDINELAPRGTIARCVEIDSEEGTCSVCGDVNCGLLLTVKHHPGDDYWCPNHWRPIYRPKADLIERLLEPVPDEPVPA